MCNRKRHAQFLWDWVAATPPGYQSMMHSIDNYSFLLKDLYLRTVTDIKTMRYLTHLPFNPLRQVTLSRVARPIVQNQAPKSHWVSYVPYSSNYPPYPSLPARTPLIPLRNKSTLSPYPKKAIIRVNTKGIRITHVADGQSTQEVIIKVLEPLTTQTRYYRVSAPPDEIEALSQHMMQLGLDVINLNPDHFYIVEEHSTFLELMKKAAPPEAQFKYSGLRINRIDHGMISGIAVFDHIIYNPTPTLYSPVHLKEMEQQLHAKGFIEATFEPGNDIDFPRVTLPQSCESFFQLLHDIIDLDSYQPKTTPPASCPQP